MSTLQDTSVPTFKTEDKPLDQKFDEVSENIVEIIRYFTNEECLSFFDSQLFDRQGVELTKQFLFGQK